MLTQKEFNDIMAFFEQQFALHPYEFLSLLTCCETYKIQHLTNHHPRDVAKKLRKIFIQEYDDYKVDTFRRMNAIYRFQIFFPKEYHKEFMGYGIQVSEKGRVQEFHWSDTVYFGEPERNNVIAYLEELNSTSLRYRPIEELASGYEKWREANLDLKTPIEVKPYLHWRIPEILVDVMKLENLSDVQKVTILMLTGTPITKEFRNRLNEMEKVITDEKERIVFFKEKKETDVELQQSYSQMGLQQLPIVPVEDADIALREVSTIQILQYLEVLQKLSENRTVPLSNQEIETAYNKSIDDPSSRIPYLIQKIPFLNQMIYTCEEIPESSRIKMLFASQTPINSHFIQRLKSLKTPTGLNLDEFDRIIKFHSKQQNCEMHLEREIMFYSDSILNPVPWGEQEIRNFFDFFDAEALQATTTMNLQALCTKYKESADTKRSWAQLYDKFNRMLNGNMDSIPHVEYIRKAYILFAFDISPHPELLRKFYKKFTIQLNSELKIIFCECRILKFGFGKEDESRPLSHPDHQKNYKSFLKKIISERNNPMTTDELVDEFLSDYPHFDTRENVENFFGDLDYKFLSNTIRGSNLLSKALYITQTEKPIEPKIVKPRPQKRRRSLTPPDQHKAKSYRSRPRGEPKVELVEEKPSARINPESVPNTKGAHPQPLQQNYDDYALFVQGNNEDRQMGMEDPFHEDRELNNQMKNEYTEDMFNQIQENNQSEIVHVDDGNREPVVHEEGHATELNNSHKILDSTHSEERNVEFLQGNDEEKLIPIVQIRIDVESSSRYEEVESQNGTGSNDPEVSGTQNELIESQGETIGASDGDDDSTVREEIPKTNCPASHEMDNGKVDATTEATPMNTDNGATVSEEATSLISSPLNQSAEHIPVSLPEAKPGALAVEQQGISTETNSSNEEETYDRKEAMRLLFRIYDSLQYNSEIEESANRVKRMCEYANGGRISMKAIIQLLKKALTAVEKNLCLSKLKNNTNSRVGDSVFVLFRLMAMDLKSSLSEEIIQISNTLQDKKTTERILIEQLLAILSSFFLDLFLLPAINSTQNDNN